MLLHSAPSKSPSFFEFAIVLTIFLFTLSVLVVKEIKKAHACYAVAQVEERNVDAK